MKEVLIKTMRRVNIFSVFLAGLTLAFLLGIFFWGYSVLKTIYMFDELAGQTYNNKEAILSQTVSSKAMENLSQPGEIAAPQVPSEKVENTFSNKAMENLSQPGEIAASQAPSEKVEKTLLSVDTVAEVEVKPINSNTKISEQNTFSREQFKPNSVQATGKKELQIEATAKHNLNNSAENSSTANITTFNGNTSKNYKIDRADELYQQITVNQHQTKEENDSETDTINSNDPEETLAADSMNSVADQNEKEIDDRVVTLRLEIERLNERIESGLSDSDYDYYLQLERPDFVIHDRERRMDYQSELEKMLLDITDR
jgi:hypothetical protein